MWWVMLPQPGRGKLIRRNKTIKPEPGVPDMVNRRRRVIQLSDLPAIQPPRLRSRHHNWILVRPYPTVVSERSVPVHSALEGLEGRHDARLNERQRLRHQ